MNNYLEKFEKMRIAGSLASKTLDMITDYVKEGTSTNTSIGNYFSTMLDQSMNWKDAEKLCAQWGGHFALKGIMSVEDAKKASNIGCFFCILNTHNTL